MAEGALFVVATPIGNLRDITLRAIDTLRDADRVLAEDTRRTRALLSHLGIAGKPIDRLDAHAEDADIPRVLARLAAGERIALVTDAGTPVVSDPGARLIRAAAEQGARVVPIPGPSAVMAAVSLAGLVTAGFRFVGFLPRSGPERREAVARIAEAPEAVVLFESPQRCAATLAELAQVMPDRQAVVARELTKVHEEAVRGTLASLAALSGREWRGEVTLVLGPQVEAAPPRLCEEEIDARIDARLSEGRRAKDITEALSLETGLPKREIYARVIARRSRA
jgi:16S rRNA (cytidine1402-2'-O)-methyltransferase